MHAIYYSHYLTDTDVANIARQSFADLADNFTPEQNESLVRFLARGMSKKDWEALQESTQFANFYDLMVHVRKIPTHWVPFAHPQITLRMQAPVPIRVQCFKSKIGLVESEESRRYISSEPKVFMPEFFREAAHSVKQGSGGRHHGDDYWKHWYRNLTSKAVDFYLEMIDDGVCPEQARFILPQGCEVNWVWTGSLYAYANFYNQRTDPHAQQEIQELARQVGEIIEPLFPVSWKALTQGEY